MRSYASDQRVLAIMAVFAIPMMVWIFVRVIVAGVKRGELRLRAGPVSRAEEPLQFWFFVVLGSFACAVVILVMSTGLSPSLMSWAKAWVSSIR